MSRCPISSLPKTIARLIQSYGITSTLFTEPRAPLPGDWTYIRLVYHEGRIYIEEQHADLETSAEDGGRIRWRTIAAYEIGEASPPVQKAALDQLDALYMAVWRLQTTAASEAEKLASERFIRDMAETQPQGECGEM